MKTAEALEFIEDVKHRLEKHRNASLKIHVLKSARESKADVKKYAEEIIKKLGSKGIQLEKIKEREFFLEVYRFMATKHILNCMDWVDFEKDPNYHLIFPQAGMINVKDVQLYIDAETDEERAKVVEEYQLKTNPHDGNQKLNKPFYVNDEGQLEIL